MEKPFFRIQAVRGGLQWMRIWLLYRSAFPRSERKPFRIIYSMHRRGKSDVWYARKGGRFAGFATTINGEDRVLLDYLAVRKKQRGHGCGSNMMEFLKAAYAGRGLMVEIEDAFAPGDDFAQRVHRRSFYLKNGMVSQRVMACVFGVNMELLCWNCSTDFESYREFYRTHNSEYAARNILEADYPAGEK